VRLLLDTHTFLWHSEAIPRVSGTATALLNAPANELILSMARAWEIAIKVGLKKLAKNLAGPRFPGFSPNSTMALFQFMLNQNTRGHPGPRRRPPRDAFTVATGLALMLGCVSD